MGKNVAALDVLYELVVMWPARLWQCGGSAFETVGFIRSRAALQSKVHLLGLEKGAM